MSIGRRAVVKAKERQMNLQDSSLTETREDCSETTEQRRPIMKGNNDE